MNAQERLYQRSREQNMPKLLNYLTTRRLELFDGIGYIDTFFYEDTIIKDSIVLFTRDSLGNITQIETRELTTGKYDKVFHDSKSIPIYNIDKVLDAEAVIITEAIHDAESLNQNMCIDGLVAISTNTASIKNNQLFLLYAILKGKKKYIAYDNDRAGLEGSNKIQHLMPTATLIDYPNDDLNKFLVKNKRIFRSHIEMQL